MAQSVFEKHARSEKNKRKLSDSRAQYFSDLWFDQGLDLTSEQQDNLGRAYLKHILGVDNQTIKQYLKGDTPSTNVIGMKMAGRDNKNDYSAYWHEVSNITPEVYSQSDLEWLIEKDVGGFGAFDFLLTIKSHHLEYSPVLDQMETTAHAFK